LSVLNSQNVGIDASERNETCLTRFCDHPWNNRERRVHPFKVDEASSLVRLHIMRRGVVDRVACVTQERPPGRDALPRIHACTQPPRRSASPQTRVSTGFLHSGDRGSPLAPCPPVDAQKRVPPPPFQRFSQQSSGNRSSESDGKSDPKPIAQPIPGRDALPRIHGSDLTTTCTSANAGEPTAHEQLSPHSERTQRWQT